MATRLLTLRDVTAMTALSRSAVYALMAESRFPKPIRVGSRAVRWVEQEVLDYIASRPLVYTRGLARGTAASPSTPRRPWPCRAGRRRAPPPAPWRCS